jgi:hydrogenase maturation protease
MTRVAVIGIGQSLRGDDAVGLEVIRQWREKFPKTANSSEVCSEVCELPGLALIDLLDNVENAILVDAIQGRFPVGSIRVIEESELSSFNLDSKSAHGWGIAETLHLGRELMVLKTNVKVVGIQVEQIGMSLDLSKSARDAIPIACVTLQKEIEKLICK